MSEWLGWLVGVLLLMYNVGVICKTLLGCICVSHTYGVCACCICIMLVMVVVMPPCVDKCFYFGMRCHECMTSYMLFICVKCLHVFSVGFWLHVVTCGYTCCLGMMGYMWLHVIMGIVCVCLITCCL